MVDNVNPTNQFHPYQPVNDTPAAEKQPGGLSGFLSKAGLTPDKVSSLRDSMKNVDVNGSLNKFRDYAKAKPGVVLGGLAAAVIGAGLMRRSMR
jgi:predicted butyrate kinase (DUF1464 family)